MTLDTRVGPTEVAGTEEAATCAGGRGEHTGGQGARRLHGAAVLVRGRQEAKTESISRGVGRGRRWRARAGRQVAGLSASPGGVMAERT